MKHKKNDSIDRRSFVLASAIILLSSLPVINQLDAKEKKTKITFGSCISQDEEQPIWNSIIDEKSDMFIFMGDNVYGDNKNNGKTEKLKQAYKKQKKKIPFDRLKQSNEIFATWDDHDYGKNDGGSEYIYKKESKELFLDFWEIPKNDPRRFREGIYFETKKNINNSIVQFIFLDTRYFRSPLKPTDNWGAPYKERFLQDNDSSKTFLGKDQWKWLSKILDEKVDLRIIISSIQVIANGHGFERWGNFSLEREKLYNLIDKKEIKNVIFLSGDRHVGGIYKDKTKLGTEIYEITSSSLNLPLGRLLKKEDIRPEPGPNRVGPLYTMENYGLIEFFGKKNVSIFIKDIDGEKINKIELSYQ
jgi:alkaline phosphatase D